MIRPCIERFRFKIVIDVNSRILLLLHSIMNVLRALSFLDSQFGLQNDSKSSRSEIHGPNGALAVHLLNSPAAGDLVRQSLTPSDQLLTQASLHRSWRAMQFCAYVMTSQVYFLQMECPQHKSQRFTWVSDVSGRICTWHPTIPISSKIV